jgi:hypothetical protein
MGASLTALLGYDVTDPQSPHSVHVASEADVPAVDPWGRPTLHRAVRLAADAGAVVLDHGRRRLYLASAERLHYRPPGTLGLGFGRPPALVVDAPALLSPDGDDLSVDPFDAAALDGPPPDWDLGAPDGSGPATADTPATADDVTGDADAAAAPGETTGNDRETDATPPATDAGTANTTDGADTTPDGGSDPMADGPGPPSTPDAGRPDAPSVTVSPTFDVLVPAFDIEKRGEPATPLERHTVESPTGTGTGTPSG